MGIGGRNRGPALLGVLLWACLAAGMAAAGMAAAGQAHAAEPAAVLNIEQAWNQGSEMLVYFAAVDAEGSPAGGLEPSALQARLGGTDTPVIRMEQFNPQSEGLAWVVLLDVSRSLDSSQFAGVQAAVRTLMSQMGPHDKMALMTFGAEVRTVCDYTGDQAVLAGALDTLNAEDENTQMYQGLLQALETARRQDDSLPARRAIVLLSDGSEDYYGGVSKDEVVNSLKIEPVPVYALGIYNERVNSDAALESMGEISRASGGQVWQCEAADLNGAVGSLLEEVRSKYLLRLDTSRCPQDGKEYRLVLTLEQDGVRLEDGVSLYMSAAPPQPAEEEKGTPAEWAGIPDFRTISGWEDLLRLPAWIMALFGGLVLILICFIIMMIAKMRKRAGSKGAAAPSYSDNEHTRDYDVYALPAVSPYDSTHQDGFPEAGAVIRDSKAGPLVPPREVTARRLHDDTPLPGKQPVHQDALPAGWLAGQKDQLPEGESRASLPREEGNAGRQDVQGKRIVLNMIGKGPGERSFQLAFHAGKNVLTAGRKAGNDLTLADDDRVSARHCQFILENGRVYVKDLASTNGTLVNGVPIAGRYALEQDDLILIGRTELRYALIQDNGGPEQ